MTKFTDEEIELSKVIAEKERKDLKIGMYVHRRFNKSAEIIYLLDEENKDIHTVNPETGKLNKMFWNNLEGGWLTPLWTLSDAIEWLKGRWRQVPYGMLFSILKMTDDILMGSSTVNDMNIKCLKAILAILNEEKK